MVMVVRVEVARRSSTPGPEFYYQYIDRNVVDLSNRGGDVFTSLQVIYSAVTVTLQSTVKYFHMNTIFSAAMK